MWLTQAQMAELFKATKQNVSLHITNIYNEGELDENSTVKDSLTVRKEGNRIVRRHVNYYNLDVILYTINICQHNHDRFLIIDDVVYLFGASLKDAGKKLFAYIQMQETSASGLLNMIR